MSEYIFSLMPSLLEDNWDLGALLEDLSKLDPDDVLFLYPKGDIPQPSLIRYLPPQIITNSVAMYPLPFLDEAGWDNHEHHQPTQRHGDWHPSLVPSPRSAKVTIYKINSQ